MYRIELSPGEETAFRSIEELAVAIRRGVVTSKARIWHNASSKWLPIQFHPHYKAAVAMPLTKADLVAGPPVTPLASLNLPDPTAPASRVTPFRPVEPSHHPEPAPQASRVTPFKPASPYPQPHTNEPASLYHQPEAHKPVSPYHQPAPHKPEPPVTAGPTAGLPLIEPLGPASIKQPLKPQPVKPQPVKPEALLPLPTRPFASQPFPPMKATPTRDEPPQKKKKRRSRKPSRRALRIAFVGALLIGGGHLLVTAGGALRLDGLRTQRRLIAAPPEVTKLDSPRTVAAVIPVLRNSSVPGGTANLSVPHPTIPAGRKPGPTLGAGTPTPSATAADSAPELQAAPSIEMPVPAPAATDSLAAALVDSTGKKVLKGILRAVSGAPGTEKGPPKKR